jgi:hypothetical protein
MSNETKAAPTLAVARKPLAMVAYIPLIAAGAVIPWVLFLFMGLIFMVGDTPFKNTPAKDFIFGCLAAIPTAGGLIVGIIQIAQSQPQTTKQRTWLWLGTIACGLWCYGLVVGFVH